LHYLRHSGPEHVLTYAPTRSGKGLGLVLPTLLSWPHSTFITDLKGELWALTAGWRKKYAHNKVIRFEPAS
ncbi:type IV secretory system conjugative DNA transfer family protein, partial [Neisseria gonorrhoeae]